MRTAMFLLGLILIVPSGAAQAPSVVLVEDSAGDALVAGAAPSPTHNWADLLKAEIEETSDDAFTLRLYVAETAPVFPDGVVVLNFQVEGHWFFMGYAALTYPGGHFEGGFYCPSDEQGNPTGECPDLPGASFGAGVFTMRDVPRAHFGLDKPGATMDKPWMESGNHVLASQWLRADRSDEGVSYVFQRGAPVGAARVPSEGSAKNVNIETASTENAPAIEPRAEAPSLGILFVLLSTGLAVSVVRSKGRGKPGGPPLDSS